MKKKIISSLIVLSCVFFMGQIGFAYDGWTGISTVKSKKRGTPAQRDYDADWRKVRGEKLKLNPLCECDQCQSGKFKAKKRG